MQHVRPLEAGDRDEAVSLLVKGFPADGEHFWRRCLDRQAAVQKGGLGFLLVDRSGAAAGILLTLRSRRTDASGRSGEIVNLSSWYIEPAHRMRAVAMLSAAMADQDAVYTDLTAAPHIHRLNEMVGFSRWNSGMILAAAAPFTAMPGRRGARIASFAEGRTALSADEAALLEWHEGDGHVAAVLMDEAAHPLLFRLIRRKGVRFAQLIYAPSRKAVVQHMPALMRFLAKRGILFATIDADRDLCPVGAFFRAGRPRFVRGPMDRDRLDYAFSELVLFGVS